MPNNHILPKTTIATHDKPPKFTDEQREANFLVMPKTRRKLATMSSNRKVRYILEHGYFAAAQRFYKIKYFPLKDIKHVKRMLNLKVDVDLSNIPDSTLERDQNSILKYFNCRRFGDREKELLQGHTVRLVSRKIMPKEIVYRLVAYCWQNNIENPGFSVLDNIVFRSFTHFKEDLLRIIETESIEAEVVLTERIASCKDDAQLLDHKKFNHEDSKAASKENSEKIFALKKYHSTYLRLIEELDVPQDVTKQFARWVKTSTKRQVKTLSNRSFKLLHMISFVQSEYYIRQDYACDAINKFVNQSEKSAKKYYKEQLSISASQVSENVSA